MDIHKPKAAHSWREFVVEIGTIICGILIALALEQLVDHFRTQAEVEEARTSLHREMAHDMQIAATWQREHACWIGAEDAAKAWATAGKTRPRLYPGLMNNYQTTVWEMTRAGAVPHMPLDERLALARFYDQVATDANVIAQHRSMATEMGGYLASERLSVSETSDLVRLGGRLRWISDVEFENAGKIVANGETLGLRAARGDADAAFEARMEDFCRQFRPADN